MIKVEHIIKELYDDYQRWIEKIEEDPYSGKGKVGIKDVLRAHYLIVDYFAREHGEGIGGVGPKDINLLHSALSRQTTGYSGLRKWNSDFDICATLFYGLIKNHPFHDANKRTAFLTLLYHLRLINRTPDAKQKDFETLAVRIASNKLEEYKYSSRYKNLPDWEVCLISQFLRKNTRSINKNEYLITYRDLNTILQRFSFGMVNPNNNHIEIVRFQEETVGLIRRDKIIVQKRIMVIGFPGWSRQVGIEDLKKVRKLTGLNPDNGVDSEVFFRGAEPFNALIWQFQGPLKRLADK